MEATTFPPPPPKKKELHAIATSLKLDILYISQISKIPDHKYIQRYVCVFIVYICI